MQAKPCRRPPWSLRRHGRGLADARDINPNPATAGRAILMGILNARVAWCFLAHLPSVKWPIRSSERQERRLSRDPLPVFSAGHKAQCLPNRQRNTCRKCSRLLSWSVVALRLEMVCRNRSLGIAGTHPFCLMPSSHKNSLSYSVTLLNRMKCATGFLCNFPCIKLWRLVKIRITLNVNKYVSGNSLFS